MEFFDKIGKFLGNTAKSAYGIVKTYGPSVARGIKKGITVAKEVVDISRDVANRLRDIPVLGSLVQGVLAHPKVMAVTAGIESANELVKNVENGYNAFQEARSRLT